MAARGGGRGPGAGLVGALVLTRFVAPQSYGEVMLASACVIVAMRTVAVGPSAYVIACHTSPGDSFQALLLQIALGTISLSRPCSSSGRPGRRAGRSRMAAYVPGLALAGFVAQISAVPAATLARDLRFDVPSVARIVGEGVYTATAVALAPVLGPGAIVAVASSSMALVMFRSDASKRRAPAWPDWPAMKRQLSFGLPLTGSGLRRSYPHTVTTCWWRGSTGPP